MPAYELREFFIPFRTLIGFNPAVFAIRGASRGGIRRAHEPVQAVAQPDRLRQSPQLDRGGPRYR